MAIDFDKLFDLLGVTVKRVNNLKSRMATSDTDIQGVQAEYAAVALYHLIDGLTPQYNQDVSGVISQINLANQAAYSTLVDRDLILENLVYGYQEGNLQAVLPLVIQDMEDQSESVTANTVTLGSVSTASTNTSVGTAIVSATLDGVTSPGSGFFAVRNYAGKTSQLADDDTINLICVQDSEDPGIVSGGESFQWVAKPPRPSPYHPQDYGTGVGPTFQCLNSQAYFANQDFETFASNAPGSWTLDSGTAGTHVFDETSVVLRGSHALKFTGDGALATISISQTPIQSLVPRKLYRFAVWVRGTSGTAAGSLTIQFEGTGYTAASSEKISLNSAALSALSGWTLQTFEIVMPLEIPDDLKLVIKVTGTLTSAKSVYFDGLAFGTPTFHGGINVVVVAGEDKYLKGDRHTFTTANNDNGVFQTWARKSLGVQFISSGSPTQADSKAT